MRIKKIIIKSLQFALEKLKNINTSRTNGRNVVPTVIYSMWCKFFPWKNINLREFWHE